jgi:hypothetical protein
MVDRFSEPGTTTSIRWLAVVHLRRIANVEQQARVRLIGVSVRHACVAKDPDLHSKRQLVSLRRTRLLQVIP